MYDFKALKSEFRSTYDGDAWGTTMTNYPRIQK